MGLYQRKDSRFWWMSYTAANTRTFESTKTSSKEIARKILRQRESEFALGLFQGRLSMCEVYVRKTVRRISLLALTDSFHQQPAKPSHVHQKPEMYSGNPA